MSETNRIVSATLRTNYVLAIAFSDGFTAELDLEPALWGPVFAPVKDAEYFRRFRLEDDTIRWPNDADFCPDVLRFWCEAGSVKTQQETDAHFEREVAGRAAS